MKTLVKLICQIRFLKRFDIVLVIKCQCSHRGIYLSLDKLRLYKDWNELA